VIDTTFLREGNVNKKKSQKPVNVFLQ